MTKKKLNFFSGSSMMACTMMGAGMLQLPSAVGSLGSGSLALGIMFVVLLITLVSLYFLMESLRDFALKKQNEQAINLETGEQVERSLEEYTYSDLSTTIHEKYGPFVANICFILCGYGTTLVYVSIIMNSVMQIITQIYGQTIAYLRLYVSLVLSFLLFLLLVKRNMRFLSKLSYAMAFSVFLLTSFLVSLYGIFGTELGTQIYTPLNLSYFGGFFSIILFAFGCQQNSIEMATTLKDFTVKKAMAAITFASLCVYTLYSIVGWLGYQLFGSFEGDFISNLIKKGEGSFFEKYTTQSMDRNGAALYFFNILFCLILACAVPIQGRCSREGVLKFFGSYSEKTWVYVLATLGHVLLMFVICVFDFKAGAIMSQIGIFVMPMICFILPALIYKSSDSKRWKSVVAICTCLLSGAYMIYCTAQNVQDFIYGQSTVNVTTIGEVN